MTRRITVLIADEQPLFRRGVRWCLERSPEMTVVGEATDGAAAIAAIDRHGPMVAIVQGELGRISGLDVAREAMRRHAGLRVILLANDADEAAAACAAAAGASALAAKSIDPDELAELVRRVAVADAPLPAARHSAATVADETSDPTNLLSERELRVVDLIARGQSNREIAESIGVSEQTVKNAVSSVLRKLGVSDRTQAVIAALRAGWITLGDDAAETW
ncbi:MAG TPA: response regulator transcription factor, partial [Thermomicrobiales bacterium]|nr:response regulator transcription factor [Thermomicrobiales bacterium]